MPKKLTKWWVPSPKEAIWLTRHKLKGNTPDDIEQIQKAEDRRAVRAKKKGKK